MKHFLLGILLFGSFTSFGQQYRYQPNLVELNLPSDTAIIGPMERTAGYSQLGDFEKEFLYALNYSRINPQAFLKKVVVPYLNAYPDLVPVYGESLISELRTRKPIQGVVMNDVLTRLATAHASDLATHNLMSHTSSNGLTTQQRFEKAGITCGSECINMMGPATPLEILVSLLVDYKVPGTGHRKSLLSPKMQTVGVGNANGSDGNRLQYTVVDLGCI